MSVMTTQYLNFNDFLIADITTTVGNVPFADVKYWALQDALREGVCVRG